MLCIYFTFICTFNSTSSLPVTSPLVRHGRTCIRSCFLESRKQASIVKMQQLVSRHLCCASMSSDRTALQNLVIVSTSAPLVPRPGHSYTLHKGRCKNSQQEHSHWCGCPCCSTARPRVLTVQYFNSQSITMKSNYFSVYCSGINVLVFKIQVWPL